MASIETIERNDSKTGPLAARLMRPQPGARVVRSFAEAREILRSENMVQGGIGGDVTVDASQLSVFFLDGELHRRRRAAIARYFTPKAIATRYRAVMEASTEELIGAVRRTGRARLDEISFQLAVNVAAEIVGLTNSNRVGMARRIYNTLSNGVAGRSDGFVSRTSHMVLAVVHAISFYLFDVFPAVRARRKNRGEDVISHLIDEKYSIKAMLLECLTYAGAGMLPTREFIVVAAWHLFEQDALRKRFLDAGEEEQIALLEEILRIEPVASVLHRKPADGSGAVCALDIRSANTDEAVTGPCPHMIDPDRARRMRVSGSYLSFGDGKHRCPGAQVALQESRIFLDRLLRVPGLRLEQAPELIWQPELMSYELRNAVVTCERA